MRSTTVALVLVAALVQLACDPKGEAPLAPTPPATSSAGTSASMASAPPSTSDRLTLLQKTFELDRLKPYWHPEVVGRLPLQVLKNDIVADAPALTLLGAPVVYVDNRSTRPFELTKLEMTTTTARVDFVHPREGVVGHVRFVKGPGGWAISEQDVAER